VKVLQRFSLLATAPRRWLSYLWHHKRLSLVLLVVIGAAFFQYRRTRTQEETFIFIKPESTTLVKKVNVSGLIDAKEKAALRFASGGKLTYLGAKEGDWVKKNQTLARIDAQELQKRLQQDLNLYFNERLDFEQGRDDRQDKAPTDQLSRSGQTSQKTLENEVLDVEIRDIAIRNTFLASPLEGILVKIPSPITGVNLISTDTFEVVNPQSLVFRVAVDEADIAQIKPGQSARIELDAYPNQPILTSVKYISYQSSQDSTGTVFLVELPIPVDFQKPQLGYYRLGMNGDADITIEEKSGLLSVPLAAIKERDDKTFVSVRTGDKTVEDREIQTGLETDDRIEVTSGLQENDEIVLPE